MAILIHATWFALMSAFGWMTFEEVALGDGFWPMAGTVYVMSVVLLWFPVGFWLSVRRNLGYQQDWVRTVSVCVLGVAFLVIGLFGLNAADTSLWIFGTFLFLFVGAASQILLVLFIRSVFLRRIP